MRIWLWVHALITLAAGVMLIAAPSLIPSVLGLAVDETGVLLAYFLGAAEIALGFLSAMTASVQDGRLLRIAVATFILFHALTAGVEVLWMVRAGVSGALVANIVMRIAAIVIFIWLSPRARPITTAPETNTQ